MKKYSRKIQIDGWEAISQRYADSISQAETLASKKIPSSEFKWLESQINPSLKKITGLDHTIQVALLFFMRPHFVRGTHVDYHNPILGPAGTIWALNIPVANTEASEMRWYDGEYSLEFHVNPMGNEYKKLTWAPNCKPTIVETVKINEPTLVYTDRPHDVVNDHDSCRVVLSIRMYPGIININPDL